MMDVSTSFSLPVSPNFLVREDNSSDVVSSAMVVNVQERVLPVIDACFNKERALLHSEGGAEEKLFQLKRNTCLFPKKNTLQYTGT